MAVIEGERVHRYRPGIFFCWNSRELHVWPDEVLAHFGLRGTRRQRSQLIRAWRRWLRERQREGEREWEGWTLKIITTTTEESE